MIQRDDVIRAACPKPDALRLQRQQQVRAMQAFRRIVRSLPTTLAQSPFQPHYLGTARGLPQA